MLIDAGCRCLAEVRAAGIRLRTPRLLLTLLMLCGLLLLPLRGVAQPEETPPADVGEGAAAAEEGQPEGEAGDAAGDEAAKQAAEEEKLAKAKDLYRQGNEMVRIEDWERALEYFLKSREMVPSAPNTLNAALCLDKLGRFDEALELYEVLLTEFREKMSPERKQTVGAAMSKLRAQVGSVDVQANVKGSLVIDGRERGTLPLLSPVRVLPGKHTVRVLKEGYRSFEDEVEVKLGESVSVQARLEPLTSAGRLRIDDAALEGAEIFIDGAAVGMAPWEGTLAPGKHLFFVRKEEEGSAPKLITVVEGQTILASASMAPLGPELRINVKPTTAELLIGDVLVGTGGWQGRLPKGSHALVVREEGYFTQDRQLTVDENMSGDISFELAVNAEHPRWGVKESGYYFIDAFGGLAVAPVGYNSQAERRCSDSNFECTDNGIALGGLVGGRGGYEFPIGISIQIGGGYLRTTKTVTRSIDGREIQDPPLTIPGTSEVATYNITDDLRVSGPFAAAGIGYRLPFAELFELRTNLMVGAHFAFAQQELSGTVTGLNNSADLHTWNEGGVQSSPNLFFMPDVFLGMRFGGFGIGLGVEIPIFVLKGPANGIGDIGPPPNPEDYDCDPSGDIRCAPLTKVLSDEYLYSSHFLLVPSLTAGYMF